MLVRETHGGKFQQEILTGPHRLLADEPVKLGGLDSGPGPYDFLLAGLGACTSMTIRLYADFKKIPLANVSVRLSHEKKIHAKDCETCETRSPRSITSSAPSRWKARSTPSSASEADGNRRQVPGAPDAGVEDRHPSPSSGGVNSSFRAVHSRANAGLRRSLAREPESRNWSPIASSRVGLRARRGMTEWKLSVASVFSPPCKPPRTR